MMMIVMIIMIMSITLLTLTNSIIIGCEDDEFSSS